MREFQVFLDDKQSASSFFPEEPTIENYQILSPNVDHEHGLGYSMYDINVQEEIHIPDDPKFQCRNYVFSEYGRVFQIQLLSSFYFY